MMHSFGRGLTLVPVNTKSDLTFGRICNTVMFLIYAMLVFVAVRVLLMKFSPLAEVRVLVIAITFALEFFVAACWAVWTGKFEFPKVEPSPL